MNNKRKSEVQEVNQYDSKAQLPKKHFASSKSFMDGEGPISMSPDAAGGGYRTPKQEDLAVAASALQELQQWLEGAGIDTSVFGQGNAKSLECLYREMYINKECKIESRQNGQLRRIVSLVRIQLLTQDMFTTWHRLISPVQFLYDGRQRCRKDQLAQTIREGENWEKAMRKAFTAKLALSDEFQDKHLQADKSSYAYEEKSMSSEGYPGLNTLYRVHGVTVYISNPTDAELDRLGLPEGSDFAVMEGSLMGKHFGSRLRVWTWEPFENGTITTNQKKTESRPRCRAPVPDELPQESFSPVSGSCPNATLYALLKSQTTDWSRAEVAVRRLRDPGYSLRAFHDDVVAAFPEIRLYLVPDDTFTSTTSGRSGDDEFQRTMGALYAFYWLARLDIDGKEGFSFGVDASWEPRTKAEQNGAHDASDLKRLQFYEKTDWGGHMELLIAAGLLSRKSESEVTACFDRCLTMLALTAIHDIMKVPSLLPIVQERDAPYNGFQAGDRINDHDLALSYVLEKYPEALPSFAGLSEAQRRIVIFTQSKLEYNQGWLVQAEAPPSALFRKFKTVLESGDYTPSDVSFYFAHWLTDLAGAEPYPLEGSEKFVLYFPHGVLAAFVKSFPMVQQLASASETHVFEEYLSMRWREQGKLGETLPIPAGESGIAMMRLHCQVQGDPTLMLDAFQALSEEDRAFLSHELARTGIKGQQYSQAGPTFDETGPALLLYYSPALMQRFGSSKEAPLALRRLCEVYRQARALWPENAASCGEHVTVRIDTIKTESHQQIMQAMASGSVYTLVKHNDKEAFVEKHPLWEINNFNENCKNNYRVLCLV